MRTTPARWSIQILQPPHYARGNHTWREIYVGHRFADAVKVWQFLRDQSLHVTLWRNSQRLVAPTQSEQESLFMIERCAACGSPPHNPQPGCTSPKIELVPVQMEDA